MVHNPQTTQDDDAVAQIAIAFVSNNAVKVEEVKPLLQAIREGLNGQSFEEDMFEDPEPLVRAANWKGKEPPRALLPAEIKRSIQPEYLICFEDGKPYKMLKRVLNTLGMTPQDYREKWGLADNYPMVSPNYSAERQKLALSMGLGRKQL